MRVLFWGTPEFAAAPLRALLGEGFEVVGVVTQPDKPRGRSRSTLLHSAVKQVALEERLPVMQPLTPRDAEFRELLDVVRPDISVVVAYGHILPKSVIDLPRLGTLNIHASLLPLLRGAAPIQAAIREGHRETGVSIMRMVPALDAGPVLLRARAPIEDDETFGDLQLRLSELGAIALIEALALIAVGGATEEPQDDSQATYAPKVTRESARIPWSEDAIIIQRLVRAYDPRPGAFARLRGAEVKLFSASVAGAGCGTAGEVLDIDANGMLVACGRGAVRIAAVQPTGRKRVTPVEWQRGRGISVGDTFAS